MRRLLTTTLWLWTIGFVVLIPVSPAHSAEGNAAVPVCFVEDTLYYMVMDLESHAFSLWYGPWELFTCSFSLTGDTTAPSGFIERWISPDRTPWQAVKRRGVW